MSDIPYIPQPQPLRGGDLFPGRASRLALAFVAALIGAAVTFAICTQYAEQHLYTHAEMVELMDGFSTMAADMGYRKGRQSCGRDI
jgi:hypothetical protein